jgi:hypothetical protein
VIMTALAMLASLRQRMIAASLVSIRAIARC